MVNVISSAVRIVPVKGAVVSAHTDMAIVMGHGQMVVNRIFCMTIIIVEVVILLAVIRRGARMVSVPVNGHLVIAMGHGMMDVKWIQIQTECIVLNAGMIVDRIAGVIMEYVNVKAGIKIVINIQVVRRRRGSITTIVEIAIMYVPPINIVVMGSV